MLGNNCPAIHLQGMKEAAYGHLGQQLYHIQTAMCFLREHHTWIQYKRRILDTNWHYYSVQVSQVGNYCFRLQCMATWVATITPSAIHKCQKFNKIFLCQKMRVTWDTFPTLYTLKGGLKHLKWMAAENSVNKFSLDKDFLLITGPRCIWFMSTLYMKCTLDKWWR